MLSTLRTIPVFNPLTVARERRFEVRVSKGMEDGSSSSTKQSSISRICLGSEEEERLNGSWDRSGTNGCGVISPVGIPGLDGSSLRCLGVDRMTSWSVRLCGWPLRLKYLDDCISLSRLCESSLVRIELNHPMGSEDRTYP